MKTYLDGAIKLKEHEFEEALQIFQHIVEQSPNFIKEDYNQKLFKLNDLLVDLFRNS